MALRTPAQIAADVKRQRIAEVVADEIERYGYTSLARVARRTGLEQADVAALVPEIQEEAGWTPVLAVAA